MKVSVIMPNWNAAPFIGAAIQSLAGDPAVGEILVVDNASSDNSIEILTSLDVPSLSVMRNQENVGASRARHQAIARAQHELLCFLDADDLLSPNALSNARQLLIDRELDMAVLQMVRLLPDGSVVPNIPPLDEIITGVEAFRRTIGRWAVQPMGVMRREVYERAIAAFNFHGFSDDELLTRFLFLEAGLVGGVRDLYYYRYLAKPPSATKTAAQARTELAVLSMASDAARAVPLSSRCDARNVIARLLFDLWNPVRSAPGAGREAIAPLLDEMLAYRLPWRMRDWRHVLAVAAMRATVRRSGTGAKG